MQKAFKVFAGIIYIILTFIIGTSPASASTTTSFTMSPMYEKIILNPGDSYSSNFSINTSPQLASDFNYKIYTQSYYRDEDNNAIFENIDGHGQMFGWISIDSDITGTLKPGEHKKISFTINVPEDAPAGGQYAVITVGSDTSADNAIGGVNIQESVAIAYTIYAEINGATIHDGKITDVALPSFIFSSDVTGTSLITNTGNVHGEAKYTLQISPIFSSEKIYTNEENPETKLILPNRTLYHEIKWGNTPIFGIFNILYTVEFEGITTSINKVVIICPIWLLFIIIFVIVAFTGWIIFKIHSHKKTLKNF